MVVILILAQTKFSYKVNEYYQLPTITQVCVMLQYYRMARFQQSINLLSSFAVNFESYEYSCNANSPTDCLKSQMDI